MKTQKTLGCMTPLAIISALVTLVVIALSLYFSGSAFFSAGSLNAKRGQTALGGVFSHSEITNCGLCHPGVFSGKTMDAACLDCHSDVAAQKSDPASLHGALLKNGLSCRSCHPDHRGPDAPTTQMDMATFPHETTGFALSAHQKRQDGQPFSCADCHGQDISTFAAATCADCHRQMDTAFMQAHSIEYGDSCLACHDGVESLGKKFNHASTGFDLAGKHAELRCAECHNGARARADFKTASGNCASCHQKDDAHDGQFGTECGSCHSPKAWKPATFDHNLSAFKLDGKHANVACADCHKNNVYKGTPTQCSACHAEPALHAGMFPGQECSVCHTTNGWSPAQYTGPHSFPMNHGERNNRCVDCHQPTLNQWTCYTCHNQTEVAAKHIHEGISNFTDCLRCHADGSKHEGGGD
ncbi:MAG: hypothetical protein OHK0031_01150 [Anaerolineales bacterium]